MKIFTKWDIAKKIIALLILIILFGSIMPQKIQAADIEIGPDDKIDGGILLVPIKSLVKLLGDAAIFIMQGVLIQKIQWPTFTVTPDVYTSQDMWDDWRR